MGEKEAGLVSGVSKLVSKSTSTTCVSFSCACLSHSKRTCCQMFEH